MHTNLNVTDVMMYHVPCSIVVNVCQYVDGEEPVLSNIVTITFRLVWCIAGYNAIPYPVGELHYTLQYSLPELLNDITMLSMDQSKPSSLYGAGLGCRLMFDCYCWLQLSVTCNTNISDDNKEEISNNSNYFKMIHSLRLNDILKHFKTF